MDFLELPLLRPLHKTLPEGAEAGLVDGLKPLHNFADLLFTVGFVAFELLFRRQTVLEAMTLNFCLRLGTDCLQFAGSQFLHEVGFEYVVFGTADVGLGGGFVGFGGRLWLLLAPGHA